MEVIVDSVIVGAGIAGLSAGLFLGRASRSTIVYDAGKQRILSVSRVREYAGFDGVAPDAVLTKVREEVLRYGAEIRQEFVQAITPRDDGLFEVSAHSKVLARTIILATGLTDELPQLSGLSEVWGDDLRVCPCFDGYEVRNQRFVVFGATERLAHMGSWVSMWSPNVTVVSKQPLDPAGAERLHKLGAKIVSDDVTGLLHESGRLVGVTTASGAEIPCDATWVALRHKAGSPLAASLCDVDEAGLAKSPDGCQTSRPGVFAVGNASDAVAHMAHAAAAGTKVGPIVTMYLLDTRIAESSTARS